MGERTASLVQSMALGSKSRLKMSRLCKNARIVPRDPSKAGQSRSLQIREHLGGIPKIRGAFLGVPIVRIIVFWGLYRGPPILGNYHVRRICISFNKKSG